MPRYPALDLTFAPGPGAGTFQDMLYAELDDFEPVAIHEHETGDGWRVFFRTPAQRDGARGALASEFGNALLQLVPVDVDDEDWARRSQSALTAIRVGRIVITNHSSLITNHSSLITNPSSLITNHSSPITDRESRAANREPRTANHDDILILINPSMGFGTGHHATTRLCLGLLQQLDVTGKRVIDVGTGSGVLAITASKLGAISVTAIDYDADALQNARENLELNGLVGAIEIAEADISSASIEPGDVVLANLTAAVLQRHASSLRRSVAEGGTLIVSGFGREELDDVSTAFAAQPSTVLEEENWVAAAFPLEAGL